MVRTIFLVTSMHIKLVQTKLSIEENQLCCGSLRELCKDRCRKEKKGEIKTAIVVVSSEKMKIYEK